jgi:hypothetical protein
VRLGARRAARRLHGRAPVSAAVRPPVPARDRLGGLPALTGTGSADAGVASPPPPRRGRTARPRRRR